MESQLQLTQSGFHVFPLGVSCFPSQGFMFSLLGFHVFPVGVSCFPSYLVPNGMHQVFFISRPLAREETLIQENLGLG